MKTKKIVVVALFSLLFFSLCVWLLSADDKEERIYVQQGSTLIIKEGVTEIKQEDFHKLRVSSFKNVQFPSSLKRIGKGAFENFGNGNFENLTSVTVPEGVVVIEENAFWGCRNLTEVRLPSTLDTIGSCAFASCENLARLDMPATISCIEPCAFSEESKLNRILCYDNGRKCYGWSGEKSKIPSTLEIPEGVVSIEKEAFRGLSIRKVVFPSSLRRLEERAFWNCENLVSLENVKPLSYIDENAFYDCRNLAMLLCYDEGRRCRWLGYGSQSPSTLTIPEGVVSLDRAAFYDCRLEEVILPKSLERIEKNAFGVSYWLDKIILSDGLDSLVRNAGSIGVSGENYIFNLPFLDLEEGALPDFQLNRLLFYANGTKCYGWMGNRDSCPSIVRIPKGVVHLNAQAFAHCPLEEIYLPEGITSIGAGAFIDCKQLKKVHLPSTLKSIHTEAFRYCESLEEINIPLGVCSIQKWAFDRCPLINKVLVYADGTKCYGWVGGRNYPDSISLPQTVVEIDSFAFSGLDSLKNIVLPDGLTVIGANAFGECSRLTNITLPNSLRHIGDKAFYSCRGLNAVDLPDSLETMGAESFAFCYAISGLNLPPTLTSMGSGAFRNCNFIKSIVIPEGIKNISEDLFRGCDNLENVEIPPTVKTIGRGAFNGCRLSSILVPNGVAEIDEDAFEDCWSLLSVKLSDSIKVIKTGTFRNCYKLRKVELPSSLERIEAYAFTGGLRKSDLSIDKRVKVDRDAFGMSLLTRWGRLLSDYGASILLGAVVLIVWAFLVKMFTWKKVLKGLGVFTVVLAILAVLGFFVFLYWLFSTPWHG